MKIYLETDGDHEPLDVYLVESGGCDRLATMCGHKTVEMRHKAEAIVSAVNSHEALLEACKLALEKMPSEVFHGECIHIAKTLRAAIALAEPKTK